MARDNEEIVNEINVPSKPSMGARVPASKDGRAEEDSLTAKHEVVTVRDAVAVPGVVKAAIKKQLGEVPGHEAGDATPLSNSGCGDCKK